MESDLPVCFDMKKVVQSRWNECSLSPSRLRAVGLLPKRCRVALERGAFSDVDMPISMEELEFGTSRRHKSRNTRRGFDSKNSSCKPDTANSLKPSSAAFSGIPTSQASDASVESNNTRKLPSARSSRPTQKYWELIADVFKSQNKTEMNKADIVARLKTRFPYFQKLRKFESRINEALSMNSMFKFVAPGVWGFKDPRTDQNGQQTARSRKRTRLRRQPNFLRIDWRKSGYEDGSIEKNNTSRRRRGRTQTTSESEEKDTSYSSSLSLEEQTSFRAGGKSAGSQPAASNLETCKKILLDFNKTLLNDVIERITEANKKCVERLISEMEAASTVTKTPAGAGEHRKSHAMVGKRNKQALQDTIDKLIANNEKCLMGLEKPVKEHRNLPLNYFETLLSTTPVVTVPCSSGLTQSAQQSSYTSAPVRTQKPIIPEEKTESVMLSDSEKPTLPTDDDIFSLPTLVKVRGRVNHHIKYGKRVIPRLTVDPAAICPKADSKIGDSEKDADSLSPMTTVSPSGASTRKILLAVDSSGKSPAKSDASQADMSQAAEDTGDLDNCNSSTAATPTDRELSVNDAFVAYARTKSDLSDIVAMIDPNVSKSISLEKSQRPATDEKAAFRQSTSSNKTSDKDPKAKQEKGDLSKTHPAEKPVVNSAREAPYSRNAVNILSRKRKADVGRSAMSSKEVAKVKREDSPQTSAANGHQQIIRQKSVAGSHASPAAHSVSAMRAAARAQAHASAQASSRGNGKGIEIRYMPPYRWRYGSNGVQQTRPSVNTNPRFLPRGLRSYQVVYPNASPSVYRNQASRIAMNSSLSLQRLPTLNDVHCRIRGATVLRMPVRK